MLPFCSFHAWKKKVMRIGLYGNLSYIPHVMVSLEELTIELTSKCCPKISTLSDVPIG